MSKRNEFNREVELVEINEAQELAVKIIMQEGALRMQELVLKKLDSESGCGDWATSIVEDLDIEEIFDVELKRATDSEYDPEECADVDHWTDDYGTVLHNVHVKGTCRNEHCTIHNPSEHAKSIGNQKWRVDRGMMERICAHGIGHPDPDEVVYGVELIHGCDGCCEK